MKYFKISLLLVFMIFLSGCTATYRLEIDGTNFNETITTYIYTGDREKATYDDEVTAQRIDAFVEKDVAYPFFENYQKSYKKEVNKFENYEQVILNFEYEDNEYINSNAINLCFENRNFEIGDKDYKLDLSGYFYCLYDNETLDIEIITNNDVVEHNAHEQKKNKYVWHINQSNYKDVDINIQFNKVNQRYKNYLTIGITIMIILIIGVIVMLKLKVKNVNKI